MATSKRRAVKPKKATKTKSVSKAKPSKKAPRVKKLVERGAQRRVLQDRRQLPPVVCDNCGKDTLTKMMACTSCGNSKAV
jgi:hypothetical protein